MFCMRETCMSTTQIGLIKSFECTILNISLFRGIYTIAIFNCAVYITKGNISDDFHFDFKWKSYIEPLRGIQWKDRINVNSLP